MSVKGVHIGHQARPGFPAAAPRELGRGWGAPARHFPFNPHAHMEDKMEADYDGQMWGVVSLGGRRNR